MNIFCNLSALIIAKHAVLTQEGTVFGLICNAEISKVASDKTGKTVAEINEALRARKIYGGIDLSQQYPELGQSALYCFTEVITVEDIKTLVDALKEVC